MNCQEVGSPPGFVWWTNTATVILLGVSPFVLLLVLAIWESWPKGRRIHWRKDRRGKIEIAVMAIGLLQFLVFGCYLSWAASMSSDALHRWEAHTEISINTSNCYNALMAVFNPRANALFQMSLWSNTLGMVGMAMVDSVYFINKFAGKRRKEKAEQHA